MVISYRKRRIMQNGENYFLKKTKELLKNFHNLTGIKICLYDSAGNELYYYPKKLSGFCEVLRNSKEMNEKCKACEKMAFSECRKTLSHYTYTCHAGLLECVTPILYDKNILGYIMIGQMRKKGDTFDCVKNLIPKENIELLEEEFLGLKKMSLDKIDSAICILDVLASYEYVKTIMNENTQKIDILIENFINDNLMGDLSVQKLCSKFHLSNNELYSVFKEYFMSTPAEYVKKRRLSVACEKLLKSKEKVNEICKSVGIFDYNYFSKIFKKTFGVSPSEYRKTNG